MTDFLQQILERKRVRLEEAKQERPLEELRAKATALRQTSQSHRLRSALLGSETPKVIAEIKRASPSKGIIRDDLDPSIIARAYARGGAAAISVLTEQDYFKGSLDDLRVVRDASSLPILRKDFLFDGYQVYESAEAGADALLLIVAALERECLEEMLRLTDALGMDALVEVHTAAEMRRALDAGAKIIGINNRDLHSFEVSLDVSVELARSAGKGWHSENEDRESFGSDEVLLVSESGIKTGADIRRLQLLGFKGFLVGETLMRSADPASKLQEIIQEPGTPRVKV